MKLIVDYVRTIAVSPEFAVVLASSGTLWLKPDWAKAIGQIGDVKGELLKWLFLLPIVMLGWVFNQSHQILFPDARNRELLDDWPDYWRLRVVCNAARFYAVLFGAMGMSVWLESTTYLGSVRMFILLTAIVGTATTALSVDGAKSAVREVLHGRKRRP